MERAIRYYTKSKKGNTLKLATFISEKLNLPALDVTHPLEEKVDQLLFVNAMYAADIDKEIKRFLKENKDHIGCVININSSASGASTQKAMKKAAGKVGIQVAEKEYHTVASWIFLNKDRPNAEDFARLEEFLKEI